MFGKDSWFQIPENQPEKQWKPPGSCVPWYYPCKNTNANAMIANEEKSEGFPAPASSA